MHPHHASGRAIHAFNIILTEKGNLLHLSLKQRVSLFTRKDIPDMSMALWETSCSSLSGVDTKNSGSQLFRLQMISKHQKKKREINRVNFFSTQPGEIYRSYW